MRRQDQKDTGTEQVVPAPQGGDCLQALALSRNLALPPIDFQTLPRLRERVQGPQKSWNDCWLKGRIRRSPYRQRATMHWTTPTMTTGKPSHPVAPQTFMAYCRQP